MSDEHKAALASGRAQAKAVRDYLDVLEKERRRGPRMNEDQLRQRIGDLQQQIDAEDDPAKRVELIQRRLDHEEQLADAGDEVDLDALQAGFIDAVSPYSQRKGISYTAWREAGVPAAVLREAGIPRTRRPSV